MPEFVTTDAPSQTPLHRNVTLHLEVTVAVPEACQKAAQQTQKTDSLLLQHFLAQPHSRPQERLAVAVAIPMGPGVHPVAVVEDEGILEILEDLAAPEEMLQRGAQETQVAQEIHQPLIA